MIIAFAIAVEYSLYAFNVDFFLGQNAETRRLQNYARHLRRLLVQRTIQHKNVYNALQRAMRKRPLTEAPAGPPPKKFRHTTRYPLNSSHLDFYGDSDPDQSVLLWSPSPESSESSRTRGPVSHPLTNNIILPVVPLKKPRSRQSSSYKPRIPYSDSVVSRNQCFEWLQKLLQARKTFRKFLNFCKILPILSNIKKFKNLGFDIILNVF